MSRDAIEWALQSLTETRMVDWAALEHEAADDEVRAMLHALRDIASIAKAYDALPSEYREVPFTWGPLQVCGHLARGAHGDVYRAWDPRLEREVALKLLRHERGGDADATFAINEGRLLARVRHPNVVAVFGADRVDGQAGLWMELIGGETLRELVATRGALPVPEVAAIGVAVCDGLTAVHAAGLVHRDIKAQNVVRDHAGRTILMDLSAGEEDSAGEVRLEGTPLYLAPEVLEGERATVVSDVYSVGVLLFFLATGRYPAVADTLDGLRRMHADARVERLADQPNVPQMFAAVVDRALTRDPAARFQSAAQVGEALATVLAPTRRRSPGRGWVAAAVVALATTAAAAAAFGPSFRWTASRTVTAGAADASQTPRRVPLPHYPMGTPSRDGREWPYVDDVGNVHVWTAETGRSRLVEGAAGEAGRGLRAVLAPGGERVVYSWRLPDGAYELRVRNTDGTWPDLVMPRVTAYEPVPIEWSKDGQRILCLLRQKTGSTDLVLVPASGGRLQLLHTVPDTGQLEASLSPDGRYVVVSAGFELEPLRDVVLVESATGAVRTLIPAQGNERIARWLPDGSGILFARESASLKSVEAWILPIREGQPEGEPRQATSTLGGIVSLHLADTGEMWRTTSTSTTEVYTVTFDLTGSVPPGPPVRVDPHRVGNHVGPSWSPDGRLLAYFSIDDPSEPGLNGRRTLIVRDADAGTARHVSVHLGFVGGYTPQWSPDNRSVAIWGASVLGGTPGWYRVDLQDGSTAPLVVGRQLSPFCQFDPDGSRFLYADAQRGIVARLLETGAEEVLVPATARPGRFRMAPHGGALAFNVQTGTKDAGIVHAIHVKRPAGASRVVVRTTAPEWIDLQAWTPDSEYLLYARRSAAGKPYNLWRIGADGAAPLDVRFSSRSTPNALSLAPDGSRLTYPERVQQMELLVGPLYGS